MLIHAIENQIFRKAAPQAIRYLKKPDLNSTHPLTHKVLTQAAQDFQVAPPVTLHISDPDLMAGVWALARESYIINAKDRAMREAVAATVSTLNKCPYCVTVHSSLFASTIDSKVKLEEPKQLPPEIAAAQAWAKLTLSPKAAGLQKHTLKPDSIVPVFATAILYHYLNRVVSVFLQETPVALPGMRTQTGQKLMRASFTFFGKRFARLDPEPGQFVLDIGAKLPPEFSWAQSSPIIAKSLAQFSHMAEKAGQEAVSKEVQSCVAQHISEWQGNHPDLSRTWLEQTIEKLDAEQKPSARLALLAARAPWQVNDAIITDFCALLPKEKQNKALLQTVSWASYITARRIASWF